MNFSFSLKNSFSSLYKPVVDTIFPPVCFLCDHVITNQQKVICSSCWSQLEPLSNEQINYIQNSVINDNFNNVYVLYDFSDIFQRIVHLLKYERCLSLALYFANELIKRFKTSLFQEYDLIVPVPLHPTKLRERGYNQSYEIVKYLPGKIGKDMLKRKKYTQSQTKLSREERINNVAEAFECKNQIKENTILLFDDIITTGSTLNECAKLLKRSGANNIDVLCLAAPLKHTI